MRGCGLNDAIKMRSLNMGTKKVNAVSGAGKTVSFETSKNAFIKLIKFSNFVLSLKMLSLRTIANFSFPLLVSADVVKVNVIKFY